jgi:hypothetical protein
MLERLGLIGVLAAAMGLMFVACGDGGDGVGATCTTTENCQTGEICHTGAKVCVRTCTAGTDCPDSAKNCEAIGGSDTRMVCKCSTDQLCAGGATTGSSAICSDAFEVCMTKCSANADCPTGSTCETSTGECRPGPTTCSTTDVQPAGCAYGKYCGTSGLCLAAPTPTCQNISLHGTTWNAQTSDGPVIYSLTQVGSLATGTQSCQAAQKLARVRVRAYRTTGTFPAATDPQAVLADLHYVLENGTESPSKPFVFPTSYTLSSNDQHLEFDLGFCPPDTISQFTAGLHFVNGNEMCVVAQ